MDFEFGLVSMNPILLFLVAAISLLSVNVVYGANNITGTVTSVLDGDTIKIGDKKIRFMFNDAPELGTRSTADDAKAFVKEHCYNKKAVVDVNDPRPKDESGRYLGMIWCNGETVSINEQSLIEDYSVLYRYWNCDPKYNEFIDLSFVKC